MAAKYITVENVQVGDEVLFHVPCAVYQGLVIEKSDALSYEALPRRMIRLKFQVLNTGKGTPKFLVCNYEPCATDQIELIS